MNHLREPFDLAFLRRFGRLFRVFDAQDSGDFIFGMEQSVFPDGDRCRDAHPFTVTEETKSMVMGNIVYLLNSFLGCSAYEHVIFCWVMHQQEIIDGLLNRLNTENCRVCAVSLVCDEDTLRQRLARDIEAGIRSSDVTARSLARMPLYAWLNTVPVDTAGKTPAQIAGEIISLAKKTNDFRGGIS